MILQQEGFRDFKRHLTFMCVSGSDQTTHIQAGPNVLHLLRPRSNTEPEKSGYERGRLHRTGRPSTPRRCPRSAIWRNLSPSRSKSSTAKNYSAIPSGSHHAATNRTRCWLGVYRHLRRHEIDTLTFDVWLTEAGRLRWTREHAVINHRRPRKPYSFTIDCWDFGVDLTELAIPASHEILYRT
jgi:hypothetical protein